MFFVFYSNHVFYRLYVSGLDCFYGQHFAETTEKTDKAAEKGFSRKGRLRSRVWTAGLHADALRGWRALHGGASDRSERLASMRDEEYTLVRY